MPFDRFETRVDPARYVRWPGGGGFQSVEILINGIGLIEIVREVELPHALREYDERLAEGESAEGLGPRGALAGNYLYLNADEVFLPSRNLLGEPYPHGFRIDPADPLNRKSLLLQCTCGITDCWFLLATITVAEDRVVWSDFRQFHRDWQYDLGPFVFERTAYERQLVMPHSMPAPIPLPTPREEQQAAVEAIEQLGGEVLYEYQRPNPAEPTLFDPEARPTLPDAFHRVVRVSLRETRATDDDLQILVQLPWLENLDLTATQIAGAGLAHLKALKDLRVLGLWKTQVDDAGLEHLTGLTRMRLLVLDDTQVTDAGVRKLRASLPNADISFSP